ncbi:MAG: hypothetical protein WD895_00930 [Acidimicrobiia bacterium]
MSVVHDEGSSRREAQDEILVEWLAAGRSYVEAGDLAGCSGRTVARRMEDAGFARRVADRRGERVVSVAGQLTSLGSEAVDVIRASMHGDSESIRLSAAKTLLDMAVRFRSAHDLELEIAEIRRHLELET